MYGIAIDLGYRYTKGINEDGKKFLALSMVGSASQRHLSGVFGNENKEDLHVRIERNSAEGGTVEAFVGDLARRESRTLSAAFDTNKIYHPNTGILLATAAGKLMPQKDESVHLVTGLPVDDFFKQKDEFKQYLENYKAKVTYFLNGKPLESKDVKFDRVTLFPQAAGAVYHALAFYKSYFKRGYLIGLVDVGMRTTDVIVFEVAEKFQLRQQFCRTLEIGVSTLYQEVISHVNELIGSNFDATKIDMIMQNIGAFYYRGREYDLTQIVGESRKNVARSIKDRLLAIWGSDLDAFRVVFLGGGGSIELHEDLKDFHNATILLEDSQFANVYGFMAVHEMTVKMLDRKKVVEMHQG